MLPRVRFIRPKPTNEGIYSCEIFKPVDPVLQEVVDRAANLDLPNIHVGEMDGLHLEVMIRMANYKKGVEVGTLAGFSGISLARAIGKDGILHTVDVSPTFAEAAKESFVKAGVADNVKTYVGPALEVLKTLESEGPFDFVFIDADKLNYMNYFNWAEKNVRVGGAVFVDNTFRGVNAKGQNPPHVDILSGGDPERELGPFVIHQLNETIANSPCWRATLLPTPLGLTVAVKIA